jgi:hypothetical protein
MRGQFGGRRRVNDDVVSVLDPERAAGNGSNDHRKVEFRHQRTPRYVVPAANAPPPKWDMGRGLSMPRIVAATPDVRDRHLRLAFRVPGSRGQHDISGHARYLVQNGISE